MNNLTNRQRKLWYFGGILLLMIPIVYLGMPGAPDDAGNITGGELAKIRHKHKLGEATLGEVDPSSSAMNLVLLGFRGVAASMLNIQSIEHFQTKNWGKFLTTVDSVINLQPHFHKVWSFQGWNMAYNVSSQWDGVADRYWWVKRGTKFLGRGTALNEDVPDLEWYRGEFLGKKIGRSDERDYFRRFFNPDGYPLVKADKKGDPDRVRWNGGADLELNPRNEDNYLVSRQAYLEANDKETRARQRVMARILFRSMPSHSLINLAQALQREGVFNEAIARRWKEANHSWVNDFGQDEFFGYGGKLRLEMTDNEIETQAKEEGVTVEDKRRAVAATRGMVNYNFWKTFSHVESLPETTAVHRLVYQGKELYKTGQVSPDGHWRATDLGRRTVSGDDAKDDEDLPELSDGQQAIVAELAKASRSDEDLASALKMDLADLKPLLEQLEEAKCVREICRAEFMIEDGLTRYEGVLEENPDLLGSDEAKELIMVAYLYWNDIIGLNNPDIAENDAFPNVRPFAELWVKEQPRLPQMRVLYNRETRVR